MFIRTYFGTPIIFSNYLRRESRFMEKILTKNAPKKPAKVLSSASPTLFPDKTAHIINKKRIAALNKLFMKYITDIMSTGNVDHSMIDKGVEVSKVVITPDFKIINVFWYSSNLNLDENIDEHFKIVAHEIHHELSQLRLMGFIPKIIFIRDKNKSKIEEVENLLVTVSSLLSTTDKDDLEPPYKSSKFPEMVSNIYGLEHEKIMQKIIVKGKRINSIKPANQKFSVSSCDPENKISSK